MVGVVTLPEQVIEKLKKNILPQWKICFFTAVFTGLVAHLYKITSWLPNWDSLVFRHDAQNMVSMGRWFLPVACAPSSFYDLPWVTGLLAIIFHALGAVCICKMFGVKKNITASLIGALVATFPTVASVMMYNYVADGYALAFLFSCIAAMLITKEKPNYIASVILIAFSTGIYQAYITVTIMLLLLHLILEVLYEDTSFKMSALKSVRFLLTGIFGMGLYYLLLTGIRIITDTKLLDYQGFGSAASLEGIDVLASLYKVKETFVTYFFDFTTGVSAFSLLNCIVFVATTAFYLKDIIRNKLSITRILLLAVYLILLPIGACVLAFISSGIDYHNLMKMGFLVFYLFLILQYETKDTNVFKSWLILGTVSVIVFNFVIIANVGYHKLNIAYDKSYGTLIRIADRIEQTDGAEECDSIAVFGYLPESEAYSVILPPDLTGATDGYILRADDDIVGQSVLCSALNDYCGKNYKFLEHKDKQGVFGLADADSMGVWPARDSIKVVDNTIIIKLGNKR